MKKIPNNYAYPQENKLKVLLKQKEFIRVLEAHNGLTGIIVQKACVKDTNGKKKEFDAIWFSSLTDSTIRGKPDIEVVDITSKLLTLNEILEVTTKPIIVDVDTGGNIEHFGYIVKSLERIGISAIVLEDKTGLKKNSLLGSKVFQTQESVNLFADKIRYGKQSQKTEDFMITARIESLILKKGMEDALLRTKKYIEAGADMIMIHSCRETPEEILLFCSLYNKIENKVPLIVVPTTYNSIYEEELKNAGVNVVIYANHLLRAAYIPMLNAAKSLLKNSRSYEYESCKNVVSIQDILKIIPGNH